MGGDDFPALISLAFNVVFSGFPLRFQRVKFFFKTIFR
jgi:hypothetical protein